MRGEVFQILRVDEEAEDEIGMPEHHLEGFQHRDGIFRVTAVQLIYEDDDPIMWLPLGQGFAQHLELLWQLGFPHLFGGQLCADQMFGEFRKACACVFYNILEDRNAFDLITSLQFERLYYFFGSTAQRRTHQATRSHAAILGHHRHSRF